MTNMNFQLKSAVADNLNFVLTNRVPRALLTRLMGWYSRIESPRLARVSIWLWRRFSDLDLCDAKRSDFVSVHDCFTRELRPGARPLDPRSDILSSPSDAIIGACGAMAGAELLQVKGSPYHLADLVPDAAMRAAFTDGHYVTLRLTAGMYHRFHAPADMIIERIIYISGDTWNVNPPALQRIPGLFCRNTRAAILCRLVASGAPLLLVPVAAILVASLRLHCLPQTLCRGYRGARNIDCDVAVSKGEELGWFEHGSTIIVIAPAGMNLAEGIVSGQRLRMGQALLQTSL
jgi:phosphatidylserine decarboxylase